MELSSIRNTRLTRNAFSALTSTFLVVSSINVINQDSPLACIILGGISAIGVVTNNGKLRRLREENNLEIRPTIKRLKTSKFNPKNWSLK